MEACSRWKRLIMVNSMQANEAPQERMSAAWRLCKRGYEPRRGSVMVKTIDATTTDRLRRSPLYLGLSPSCARKRACMELTTICRFQRLKIPPFDFFSAFAFGMFQTQPTKRQSIATHDKGVISISFLQFHTPLPHIKKNRWKSDFNGLNRCHLPTPQKNLFVKICANSWLKITNH